MKKVDDKFTAVFPNEKKKTIYSPYRVCPLGAHVDHQHGVVIGMALDHGVDFVFSPRTDGMIHISSLDFEKDVIFDIKNIPPYTAGFWGNYIYGSALILRQKYNIQNGFNGVVEGSLPIGGLSSSAAVLSAYLLALADANGLFISRLEYISLARWVENKFIGLNNGILDQASNQLSKNGFLLYMDTENEIFQLVEKPKEMPDFEIGVFYSGISKALISTDYNNRVSECKEAARLLYSYANESSEPKNNLVLRDIDEIIFQQFAYKLPIRYYKRAKHFYDENNRVHHGIEAWKQGDLMGFGNLMFASGNSSINLYESGCPELIALFTILKATTGIYGARFSGAGYRGCCIAFVNPAYKNSIKKTVTEQYLKVYPQFANVFQIDFCKTDDGVRIL